jgi:hypothetical protein
VHAARTVRMTGLLTLMTASLPMHWM